MFINDLSGSNPCVLPPPDICRTFTSKVANLLNRKKELAEMAFSKKIRILRRCIVFQ